MTVNPEKVCWSTSVGHNKIDFDYVDCYLMSALHEPCVELGGLSYVRAESIMADATERFGDDAELPSWIDRAKATLESEGLIAVKENASGIHVGLTITGLTVARRLQAYLNKYIPLMRLCDRMENPILRAIDWTNK